MKKWVLCIVLLLATPVSFADSRDDQLNDPRSVLDRPEYNEDQSSDQRAKSGLAWGLKYARHEFPVEDALGDLYQIYGEWIIPWDKIGLFSIGANLGVLSIYAPETTIPYPNLGNPFLGSQITYQLKFWQNQWLVPAGTVFADYYRIRLSGSGDSYASGAALGFSGNLLINLGSIDRASARDAYRSIGLTKGYLLLGLEQMSLSDAFFSLSGSFWTMGIRLEYQ